MKKVVRKIIQSKFQLLKICFILVKMLRIGHQIVLHIPISSTLESDDAFFIQGTKLKSKLCNFSY